MDAVKNAVKSFARKMLQTNIVRSAANRSFGQNMLSILKGYVLYEHTPSIAILAVALKYSCNLTKLKKL